MKEIEELFKLAFPPVPFTLGLIIWPFTAGFVITVIFCMALYHGGKLAGEWGIAAGSWSYDKWEAWRHPEEARRIG